MRGQLGKNVVIAVALLATGFFAAYLRFRPHLGNESSWTDGERHFESALAEKVRYAIFDEPAPLAPAVNTGGSEVGPAVSADGLYLVFVAGEEGLNRDLYVAELVDGEPSTARPLSLVNSPNDEIAPCFAGDVLYFASDRAGGAGGFDLYRSRCRNGAFDPPEPLPGGVNTKDDEVDPAVAPGSDAIAYASNRERGNRRDFDLYLATPGATSDDGRLEYAIEPLAALNSNFDDREPAFTADGVTVFFASDRDAAAGGFDLFRSVRDRGAFLPPEAVPGVNTECSERTPRPSADGFTLWFAAEEEPATFDLYRARSRELFRVPGRPIGWFDLLVLLSLLLVALLAWLAKRWETLDVLYKCFLVALLLHLLLLWWFQRVPVEGAEIELPPGRDALFKVSIASARTQAGATRERAGRLDATPNRARAEGAPDRVATAVAASVPRSAPNPSIERAAAVPESSPARQHDADSTPAPPRPRSELQVAFEDRGETIERRTGAAPALALAAPARTSTALPARDTTDAPERGVLTALSTSAIGRTDLSPARPTLARAERVDTGGELPAKQGAVAPSPDAADDVGSVALEDRETFEPVAAGIPGDEALEPLAPKLASTLPSRDEGLGAPSRIEAFANALLDGDDRSPAFDAAPAASELPRLAGSSGPDATPTRERGDFAPAADGRAAELPAVALNDDEEAPDERGRPDPDDSDRQPTRSGDLLAALTPRAAGDLPRRARATATSPTRLAFDVPARPSAPTFVPKALVLDEVRRPPETEVVYEAPARLEHTPYKNRFGLEKQKAIESHGGSRETEQAVAMGLKYLRSRQSADGYWGSSNDYEEKYGYVCIGKSALCLLAFLGAGHTPASGTEHSDVARRAVDFLLQVQDDESGHFGWTSAYSHGIATYALAECYAITEDETLRRPIDRAVAHILANQNTRRDPRLYGGWGYFNPEGPHYDQWARVSVSAWQIMALESARLAGVPVPDEAFENARTFLANTFDEDQGYFRYSHEPARLNSNYPTLPASTPAALFALSLLGEEIKDGTFRRPRMYVLQRRPREYRCRSERTFVADASGNLYFWYYATLAMFRVGGDEWQEWNAAMKETLLPSQERDGSWRPISPYAERAKDTNRDRCYSTAMCVLTLEVYYRYFTPLLKVK